MAKAAKKTAISLQDSQFLYRAYCTNTKEKHRKYYDIVIIECTKTVAGTLYTHEILARWGRLGTRGKIEHKGVFLNLEAAKTAAKSLELSKLRRGYISSKTKPPANLWTSVAANKELQAQQIEPEDSDFERFELLLLE